MNTGYIVLALLMAAVTYPSRAIPLLVPQMRRLPEPVLDYLRLVGPAVLASLAAVSLFLRTDASGKPELYVGPEVIAVAICIVVVARRRNLLLGLILASVTMALLRAFGLTVI